MEPDGSNKAPTDWREIAKELAHALACVPNQNVFRDFAEGYTPARYIVDLWDEDAEAALERWRCAEHDAACDDLFNPPSE